MRGLCRQDVILRFSESVIRYTAMRRYLQGTLDFDCAVYAVINALARTRDIELAAARYIYQETMLALSACPRLWEAHVRNGTDHYWMVRHLLSRWCGKGSWHLRIRQPFGDCLLPEPRSADLAELADDPLYLPEGASHAPAGRGISAESGSPLPGVVWDAIAAWLDENMTSRAVIFRFHRFVPGLTAPVLSHWTCGIRLSGETLFLHDASGEKHSLHSLKKDDVIARTGLVRIAPESVIVLEPYSL